MVTSETAVQATVYTLQHFRQRWVRVKMVNDKDSTNYLVSVDWVIEEVSSEGGREWFCTIKETMKEKGDRIKTDCASRKKCKCHETRPEHRIHTTPSEHFTIVLSGGCLHLDTYIYFLSLPICHYVSMWWNEAMVACSLQAIHTLQ